jgi:VCBS repeat-containing protein
MSYNKEELVQDCVDIIEEHGIFNITQLVGFLSISTSTFYNYELEKSKAIKDALRKSRAKEFTEAFTRMKANESATAQIATIKILGDDDVRDALNGNNKATDHDGDQTEFEVVDNLHDED